MMRMSSRRDQSAPPRERRLLRRLLWLALASPRAAVGGQAVMDGVMMRGPHGWAVAIRRHDGSIAVHERDVVSFAARHWWARLPLVRGVVALVESLVIGMRALFVSSEYAIQNVEAAHNDDTPGPEHVLRDSDERLELNEVERAADIGGGATSAIGVPLHVPHHEREPEPDPDSLGTTAIVISMIVALAFSIGLFKLVPVSLTALLPLSRNGWGFVVVEAAIKFAIFCVYLVAVGFMPDMRRVFQYHSAEHKAINAWEHEVPLEPDEVNRMSRIHVRCGTAFIVWLFLIGMLVFRGAQLTFLHDAPLWMIIAARPVLLPLIAGVSFEILRFAGGHADNRVLRAVLAPGLWFQRLTTRECTPAQCEVAVRALDAVLAHPKHDFAAATRQSDAARAHHDDAYEVLA